MPTTTTKIARSYAEACRREALLIEGGIHAFERPAYETERRHYVAVWNTFCAQGQARLDRLDRCLAQIRRHRNARVMGRAARLFLVWGNRTLADAAHARRGVLLEQLSRMGRKPSGFTTKGIPWSHEKA